MINDKMRFALQPGDRVRARDDNGNEANYPVTKAPWQLGHGEWVIGLLGISGGYKLSRVTEILTLPHSDGLYKPSEVSDWLMDRAKRNQLTMLAPGDAKIIASLLQGIKP